MRFLYVLLFLLVAKVGAAQVTVGFHQSNLPFFSFGYEGKSRFVPELRIGMDNYISSTSLEGVVLYQFLRRDEVTIYGGLGGRVNNFGGLVIPIGANVYPFAAKSFGFHMELAPLIGASTILRGSGGIRYRFRKAR